MSDDYEPPENVVELWPDRDPRDEQRPLHTRERKPFCLHARVELDTQSKRVYCRECKDEVPAFKVLENLAREWERLADFEQTRLEQLRRQETNAKARRRRRVKVERATLPDVVEAARGLVKVARALPHLYRDPHDEFKDLRCALHVADRALSELDEEIRESA